MVSTICKITESSALHTCDEGIPCGFTEYSPPLDNSAFVANPSGADLDLGTDLPVGFTTVTGCGLFRALDNPQARVVKNGCKSLREPMVRIVRRGCP